MLSDIKYGDYRVGISETVMKAKMELGKGNVAHSLHFWAPLA